MSTPTNPITTADNNQPAAPSMPAQQAPDLSALTQAAPSYTPNLQDAALGSAQQDAGNVEQATKDYASLANKPVTPAPVPGIATGAHARLINMISGLALGADAFGKSLATHGREGGVQEVEQQQAEQQRMQQSAQQAAQAQRNEELQQKLVTVQTNQSLMQNHLLLAKLPTELTRETLLTQQAAQGLATSEADFRASHFGMDATEFNSMIGSTGNSQAAPDIMRSQIQQTLSAATQNPQVGPNDPYVKQVQQVLANPKATARDLWAASENLNRQVGLQKGVTEATTAQQAAAAGSPVAKLSTPEALAAPGAAAAIQAKIDDPSTNPNDVSRLRALLPQAAVAQNNVMNQKVREQRAQQVTTQGDPDAAGKLLANRSLTLDELKSRQVTPQFIESAVAAAQKYDPTFKAAEAVGQAAIAKSAANQQFFGNTDSLLVKGGTLDQLDTAGSNLGNTKIPALNTLENWRKTALGQGPQAAFAAAALGVADDYSKVMTGGQGSDTSRLQALNIINKNLSPEGRVAAIEQIRQAVESQRNGRVGTNPYLRDMYPDPSVTRQQQQNNSQQTGGSFFNQFGGVARQ